MDVCINLTTLNPDKPSNEPYNLELQDEDDTHSETVILYGSGDMATALAIKLLQISLHPIIASRNPGPTRKRMKKKNLDIEVLTIQEAVTRGNIIIVAVPSMYHSSLPKDFLKDKILIDISNRSPSAPSGGQSLSEQLQHMFPNSHVVKAFNTLSAYSLIHGLQGCKEVPICGDSKQARHNVASLVTKMGFIPVDYGGLRNTRAIEDMPLSFFPQWKMASILCLCLFIFNWTILLFRSQLCPNIESDGPWDWSRFHRIPLSNTQRCLAYTAAYILLLTYIPGTFAGYIQLLRGTKYSQFPNWLDEWLKSRKQLGLLALLLGMAHGCAAILGALSYDLSGDWKDQLYLIAGTLLAALLAILGITSLPSVSATLTWREFSFVQRYLGWLSVIFLFIHCFFCNLEHMLDKPRCAVIPSLAQVFFVLCMVTFLLKIPLILPCISSKLTKIRNGYEKSTSKSSYRVIEHSNMAYSG